MKPLLRISNQIEYLLHRIKRLLPQKVWAFLLLAAFISNIFGPLVLNPKVHAITIFLWWGVLSIALFGKNSLEEIDKTKYLGLIVLILFDLVLIVTVFRILY